MNHNYPKIINVALSDDKRWWITADETGLVTTHRAAIFYGYERQLSMQERIICQLCESLADQFSKKSHVESPA